jgi:hypothetical protein
METNHNHNPLPATEYVIAFHFKNTACDKDFFVKGVRKESGNLSQMSETISTARKFKTIAEATKVMNQISWWANEVNGEQHGFSDMMVAPVIVIK